MEDETELLMQSIMSPPSSPIRAAISLPRQVVHNKVNREIIQDIATPDPVLNKMSSDKKLQVLKTKKLW